MIKKRNFVVANWKLNPSSLDQAKSIFNDYRRLIKPIKNTDLVVCPPFPFLTPLAKLKFPKNILFGVQDIATEAKGAFTGEVSAEMVKSVGASFAIIGHSERRAMGETGDLIKKKLQMAFDAQIIPILCIGESIRDKEGQYLDFLKKQIEESLSGLPKKNLLGLMIAYEPIWAIGKSYREAMTPTDIHEITLFIKKVAGELLGKDIANSFKILYGAAVEAENASDIMRIGNVEGFLVGHASLVADQFGTILKSADMRR